MLDTIYIRRNVLIRKRQHSRVRCEVFNFDGAAELCFSLTFLLFLMMSGLVDDVRKDELVAFILDKHGEENVFFFSCFRAEDK